MSELERREPVFSDQDIARLVEAIKTSKAIEHECRFADITPEDMANVINKLSDITHDEMMEAIRLAKRINSILDDSSKIIGRFILRGMLTITGILISGGLYAYFKGTIKSVLK